MQSVTSATAVATTARANNITLFASLELSKSKWVVTINGPGSEKFSKHVVEGGDGACLLDLLSRSRAKAEQRYGVQIKAIVIQEAGLDGFWIHRLLLANGIESHVVDAASIAVARRHRRAKTDAIDGETLLRTLMAWARGERRVCSMVRAPSPGRRGSPAADARARHAAQGTHSAHQPDPGPEALSENPRFQAQEKSGQGFILVGGKR
jgi:transposase